MLSLLCSDTLSVQRVDLSSINVNIPIKPLCAGFYVIKASFQLFKWNMFYYAFVVSTQGQQHSI